MNLNIVHLYLLAGNMSLAISEDGLDIQAYFAWSLMDNFEYLRHTTHHTHIPCARTRRPHVRTLVQTHTHM